MLRAVIPILTFDSLAYLTAGSMVLIVLGRTHTAWPSQHVHRESGLVSP